jgi:hypothetical protein
MVYHYQFTHYPKNDKFYSIFSSYLKECLILFFLLILIYADTRPKFVKFSLFYLKATRL